MHDTASQTVVERGPISAEKEGFCNLDRLERKENVILIAQGDPAKKSVFSIIKFRLGVLVGMTNYIGT